MATYNSPFAPAQIDFSGIGRLADSYYGAQNDALKRQAYQDERAQQAAERQRQAEARRVISGGIPTGPDGQPDYGAMAQRFAQLGDAEGARNWLSTGAQERERAATRAHQERTFAADQTYRDQQLGLQRDQLVPSDVREYKFYTDQEKAAGRQALPYNDWKRTATSSSFGRSGTIVQGGDGKFYSIQFGSDGSRKIEPLEIGGQGASAPGVTQVPSATPQQPATPPVPLTPSRGVKEIDTGTGTQIIDGATGLPVRDVKKDIAGAEKEKVIGREGGERQMTMPKARAALTAANTKADIVLHKIKQARPLVSGWTVGFGSLLSNLPATEARNLREIINTIKANAGFDELQTMRDNSPTGGALGQVAVLELEMLQKTVTSLEQAQTVEQFNSALDEFEAFAAGAKQRRAEAFEETYGATSPQAAQQPASPTGWSIQRVVE